MNNQRCENPCHSPGVCGINTYCNVVNHSPVCACTTGYNGDPFVACSQIPISKLTFNLYFNVDKYKKNFYIL